MAGIPALGLAGQLSLGRFLSVLVACETGIMVMPVPLACCEVFIKFVTILFLFWFFGLEACGILVPQPGTEPAFPASEGKVRATGLPGKSLVSLL